MTRSRKIFALQEDTAQRSDGKFDPRLDKTKQFETADLGHGLTHCGARDLGKSVRENKFSVPVISDQCAVQHG